MATLCDPLSKRFRELLHDEGVQGTNSYEWLDGEALYRGECLSGRLTYAECQAVVKMIAEQKSA